MVIAAVDPNKKDLKRLVMTLHKAYPGCTVVMFTDSSSAAEYMEENPIDILFTEISMFYMDGFALQAAAEAVQPGIFTVFVTDTDVYAGRAIKTKAAGYILKPINREDIYEALAETKFQYRQPAYKKEG